MSFTHITQKPFGTIAGILFMTVCFALSCGKRGGTAPGTFISADSLSRVRNTIGNHLARGRYDEAISLSTKLKKFGTDHDDPKSYLTGITYLSQTYLALEKTDSMRVYLDQALALGLEQEDYWALATVYNSLGIYAMFTELDYLQGIALLAEGVKYAELSGDDSRLFMLKCNLALGYYFRNDPAGLVHALDAYEIGKAHDSEYMIFSGAVASGYLYYLSGDYDMARRYIEEAMPLTEVYGDKGGVYSVYGDIMLAMGDEQKAVDHYLRALSNISFEGHYSSPVDTHLSYGAYLMKKRRFAEAIRIMEQGVELVRNTSAPVKRYRLYHQLSIAYDSVGDKAAALAYYKRYDTEAEGVFNADKERSIGELKVRYERERHENEMLKSRKKLQVAILLIVVILIVAVAGYTIHYRTARNYRSLLKKHQQSREMERFYRSQLEQSTGVAAPQFLKSRSQDKMEELYASLQEVMLSQELYKNPDLSRDKLAGILSTNRTYLTEVIRKFTGLSFIYYVNSFRIDEAVRVLSDPDNDVPIKALSSQVGFNSLSVFYKFFQAATGMPPSQFRNRS